MTDGKEETKDNDAPAFHRFLAWETITPLAMIGSIVWACSQMSLNTQDAHQRIAAIEAQSFGPRVAALEAEIAQLKSQQDRMVDSLHGIDVHMQSMDDGLKSVDQRIAALAEQEFPARHK